MTLPAPTYDLVLLLDPQAEEPARAKIVADARAAIEAQGELLRHDDWGERALAYPIDRKASAEYHLLQFHAGDAELLGGLDRTLRITDGVLRFRIIKLKPGVPDAPDMRAGAAAAPTPSGEPSRRAAEPRRASRAAEAPPPRPSREPAAERRPLSRAAAEAAGRRAGSQTAPAESRDARVAQRSQRRRVIRSAHGLGEDMNDGTSSAPTCCAPRRRCSSRACSTRSRACTRGAGADLRARRSSRWRRGACRT